MNKIPNSKLYRPLAWQKRLLSQWLREWEIYRRLKEFPPVEPGVSSGPVDLESFRKFVRGSDSSGLVPGEIRLLSHSLTPAVSYPVYVSVVRDWDEGWKLIAPFSPFALPATPGELLFEGREAPLKVLSLWNSCTVPPAALERSWFAGNLSAGELEEAWAVFRYETTGIDLPASLTRRVGPPIFNPRDPRLIYQKEQVGALRELTGIAVKFAETEDIGELVEPGSGVKKVPIYDVEDAVREVCLIVNYPPRYEGIPLEKLLALEADKLAAKEGLEVRARYKVPSEGVILLFVITLEFGGKAKIFVLDKKGGKSPVLDGWKLNLAENKLVSIKNSSATVDLRDLVGDISGLLRQPDGSVVKIAPLNGNG